eukprot:2083333-Lingulodinium_polyedra.AAC.1
MLALIRSLDPACNEESLCASMEATMTALQTGSLPIAAFVKDGDDDVYKHQLLSKRRRLPEGKDP